MSDYDEEIAIDVPAGRMMSLRQRRGRLAPDPLGLLPGYRSSRYPGVDALGLESEDCSCSGSITTRAPGAPNTTERSRACSREFGPCSAARDLAGGWWNTSNGEVIRRDTATATSGGLSLTLPDFSSDMASRVDRTQPGVPK